MLTRRTFCLFSLSQRNCLHDCEILLFGIQGEILMMTRKIFLLMHVRLEKHLIREPHTRRDLHSVHLVWSVFYMWDLCVAEGLCFWQTSQPDACKDLATSLFFAAKPLERPEEEKLCQTNGQLQILGERWETAITAAVFLLLGSICYLRDMSDTSFFPTVFAGYTIIIQRTRVNRLWCLHILLITSHDTSLPYLWSA